MKRLTNEQLNAIRERAERATPGPWKAVGFYGVRNSEDCSIPLRIGDHEFIAHAREDVPMLLAEIERLRREISFIAHVDLTKNAYNAEHIAVSVKCWALDVLDGVNHDD